jgi:hypothetical protein
VKVSEGSAAALCVDGDVMVLEHWCAKWL